MTRRWRRARGATAALLTGTLVACLPAPAVECADGSVCPAGTACLAGGCASDEQVAACAGLDAGAACVLPRLGAGVCQGGACLFAVCGDGVVAAPEVCDDGNNLDGDGCSRFCDSDEACGNGIRDVGEACDCGLDPAALPTDCAAVNDPDGTDPAATCRGGDGPVRCVWVGCGNALVELGEACDDGNNVPGDGCRYDCASTEACGNAFLDPAEECDDGNLATLDGCSPACVVDGFAGYWPFDDGAGASAAEASGGAGAITLVGGVGWTTGQVGGAIVSDGAPGSYATLGSLDLDGTDAITVAMWVRRDYSGLGGRTLFELSANFNVSETGLGIFPDVPACGIYVALRGDGDYNRRCYDQPTSNAWHRLVLVADKGQPPAQELTFYVDGVRQEPTKILLAETDNTNDFGNEPVFLFARGGTEEWNAGEVDDLRIYPRALTPAELAGL